MSIATAAGQRSIRAEPRERACCSRRSLAKPCASSTSALASAACSPVARRPPRHVRVGVDVSELMLAAACERFARDERIELVRRGLAEALPALGRLDAVVSSMAVHHLEMPLLVGLKPAEAG